MDRLGLRLRFRLGLWRQLLLGIRPRPYWGPCPTPPTPATPYGLHGGAAVWGPGGWAATTGNVYQHWGATTAVSRGSAGYNAWTGNAWSSRVGTSYNSVTGRASAGQRAAVQNVYTGNYATGSAGPPTTRQPVSPHGVAQRPSVMCMGANSRPSEGGRVTGPGGQTAGAARVGNDYYADHNGNMYKNTGSGWAKYDNGSWNCAMDTTGKMQSLQAQQQARQWGVSCGPGAQETGAVGLAGPALMREVLAVASVAAAGTVVVAASAAVAGAGRRELWWVWGIPWRCGFGRR